MAKANAHEAPAKNLENAHEVLVSLSVESPDFSLHGLAVDLRTSNKQGNQGV